MVLLVDEFLAKEGLLAHSEPEFAIEVTLGAPVKVLEETLGALFHHLLELVRAFAFFRGRVARLQQTKFIHEECVRADVNRLRVSHDLPNDPGCLVLLGIPDNLLQALLDKAGEVDDAAIACTLNLIILKQNVRAIQTQGLIDYIMG